MAEEHPCGDLRFLVLIDWFVLAVKSRQHLEILQLWTKSLNDVFVIQIQLALVDELETCHCCGQFTSRSIPEHRIECHRRLGIESLYPSYLRENVISATIRNANNKTVKRPIAGGVDNCED